jgi:hypothetical protein
MQTKVKETFTKARLIFLLVKLTWIISAVVCAISLLSCERSSLSGECRLLYWGLLGILTFPSCVAWGFFIFGLGFLLHILGIDPMWPKSVFVAIEFLQAILVVTLGYFQWFLVLPSFYKRWKARNNG